MRKLMIALFMLLPFVFANGCAYVPGSADPVVPTKGPTAEESMQEQAEKEKWVKIRAEKAAQGRRDAVFPVQFEMIALRFEKEGRYNIILAFQPGDTPIADFERELRENVTGEIEIRHDNVHYKTIRFEEFTGFAPAPVGTGYGPTYSVNIEYGGLFKSRFAYFDFYPRIRAKKPYRYAFSLRRQQRSGMAGWNNLLNSKEQDTQKSILSAERPGFQIPSWLERFDMFMELATNYGFGLGIRMTDEEERTTLKFEEALRIHYAGDIDILRDDKLFRHYDFGLDPNVYESVWCNTFFTGYGYKGFIEKEPVWYSFMPSIRSVQKGRSFAIKILSGHMGK
ncbi:hypothetical protein [Desulfobulbus oralis]|nr:hypothetical protein [Desulfobulbus oralis]